MSWGAEWAEGPAYLVTFIELPKTDKWIFSSWYIPGGRPREGYPCPGFWRRPWTSSSQFCRVHQPSSHPPVQVPSAALFVKGPVSFA